MVVCLASRQATSMVVFGVLGLGKGGNRQKSTHDQYAAPERSVRGFVNLANITDKPPIAGSS